MAPRWLFVSPFHDHEGGPWWLCIWITHCSHSIQLPDYYYRKAFDAIAKHLHHFFLIVVGNDPDFAETLFADVPDKYVSRLSAAEDLALMAFFSGGVLSNSTFAWWGAFFGEPGGVYLAPRYWSGFAFGQWVPAGMNTALVTEYIDVPLIRK